MSAHTIPAHLVASGVGLPAVWFATNGDYIDTALTLACHEADIWQQYTADLSDPQTRQGCLRQLAIWAGDSEAWQSPYFLCWDYDGHTLLMRAAGFSEPDQVWRSPFRIDGVEGGLLTYIGMDHEIRRALGWPVERGTLATLDQIAGDVTWWVMSQPGGRMHHFTDAPGPYPPPNKVTHVPALAGITDSTQALAAIHAEVVYDSGVDEEDTHD